jgi:hypothetical protein
MESRQKRDARVTVRFYPHELEAVEKAAAQKELDTATFVREATLAALGNEFYTPLEAALDVAEAFEQARYELTFHWQEDGEELEDVLAGLERTSKELQDKLLELQSCHGQLLEEQVRCLDKGATERASELAKLIDANERDQKLVKESLERLAAREEEIRRRIELREQAIRARAAELLRPALAKACAVMDRAGELLGAAYDAFTTVAEHNWHTVNREPLKFWAQRLQTHAYNRAYRTARHPLAKELIKSATSWCPGLPEEASLADILGVNDKA